MRRPPHRAAAPDTAAPGGPAAGLRHAALALTVALAVAVGGSACTPGTPDGTDPPTPSTDASSTPVFPRTEVAPLVDAVTHRTVKPLATKRLAGGLVPPTNRWFSGLVFGEQPQPVFPLPLSFGLTGKGFAFGQPTVTTTAKNIAGGFKPDVDVDLGAASTVVSGYDALTVTLASTDTGGKVLGHTTIAEGSPFVTYTAAEAGTLTSALPFTAEGDHFTATAGGVGYGLVVHDGSVENGTVALEQDGTATFFVVPADGSAAALAALAADPVTGGSLGYAVDGDEVSTSLTYTTGGRTAFAAMPHQQATLDPALACDLGTYPSIYGTLKVCSGTTLAWTVPRSPATGELDLGALDADERTELATQVEADVEATPAFPADTYFGGKALYRAAMLYRLARQLGEEDAAARIKTRLTDTLAQWTDPQGCATRTSFCFVYDEQAHGLVGLTPSFGSDEFNDHHFHYGYFLYAAGVLAQDDSELATRYAPVMDLLAADLASSAGNGAFPDQRVFDAYASHSWASGTSPFADGNNQESSSEAVTAWTGLALWARASGNAGLATEADWLLSSEAHSGLAYWTNVDRGQPVYDGFDHQVVSLNWGGKRDYGTWFSAEPAAMLGILVIPMSPASTYLAGDPAQIEANVAEATSGTFDQKFGDYLLMYSGLAGEEQRAAALELARGLDARWIDDGNSRAYLLAWLMSVQAD
ncbi:Endoglucanase Acf2 [Friedmanniella luteola]|uniref:glucan endo-1,3-beta-D-glucosidase n=1 Tax=Friedmanniella luteola TaxID=546871 RepID=A0A1H1YTU0_9ACTN|nr:glycosyl hydrolase [Friedmanniella luteola]SDT24848.1 Endoglucanase Acf2 [Friedmanniella luteola]